MERTSKLIRSLSKERQSEKIVTTYRLRSTTPQTVARKMETPPTVSSKATNSGTTIPITQKRASPCYPHIPTIILYLFIFSPLSFSGLFFFFFFFLFHITFFIYILFFFFIFFMFDYFLFIFFFSFLSFFLFSLPLS